MRKKLVAMMCLVGLCMGILAGCGTGDSDKASSSAAMPADSAAAIGGTSSMPAAAGGDVTERGNFKMDTIDGKTFTSDDLKGHKLTLVNVFATFCNPCIAEIPDLNKLNNEMKDKGVQVIGVVMDVTDGKKELTDIVDKAKKIQKDTGAEYPFCKPDKGMLNGRLAGITTLPTTFLVDENGKIVGETYAGSKSLDEWKQVIEQELAKVQG